MNRIKKVVNVVLVISLLISSFAGIGMKEAKAAGYSDARTISLNGGWSQDYYLTETNKEHWYKIVVPADGKVQLKLMRYVGGICLYLYNGDFSKELKSANGWVSGTETSPETSTFDFELSQGTYYVKIKDTDYVGKYKLNATYSSYQVTDGRAQSYNNPQSFSVGEQVVGALTYTDTEDWFKISINRDACYVLKSTSYINYLEYKLYNSDLSVEVSSKGNWGKENEPSVELDEVVLSAGTYYLKVWGVGDRGKYILNLNQLNQSNCNHDYTSSYHDATYFSKGYSKYVCSKCGHSYKDDYSPKKKLDKGYLYSFCTTGKGSLILSWTTISDASGYQIRYGKKKSMKGAKIKKIKGRSKSKKTIKRLSRRKRYYVQIRAYKKSGAKIVYGKWSPKRRLRTK